MKVKTVYIARDGNEYDSELDCRRHEVHVELVGLAKRAGYEGFGVWALTAILEDGQLHSEFRDICKEYADVLILHKILDRAKHLNWHDDD